MLESHQYSGFPISKECISDTLQVREPQGLGKSVKSLATPNTGSVGMHLAHAALEAIFGNLPHL